MVKGYVACDCPDCFEITIAGTTAPYFCHDCEEAGCDTEHSCSVDHCKVCQAYISHADDCVGCGYNPVTD